LSTASSQPAQSLRVSVLHSHLPNPDGITIGLVGRGIAASLSPLMHEHEGARQGLDYRYHLIDFDRLELDDASLPDILAEAHDLGFAGLNVTYPFKQAILPLLDDLAPDAAAIGAVNTVVLGGARTVGHNTDCWGFAESFRRDLPDVARGRVLQLGSGGAGAAVSQALLQCGAEQLDIYDTDMARAEMLATRLRRLLGVDVQPVTEVVEAAKRADGLVNATPVGMSKHPGLPIDPALLESRHWVADVVYFPLETELIRRARALGCPVLSGGGMAVYQAVRAFELFTGRKADVEAMRDTFRAAVRGS
jgi:shikimate dehydrogenase